MYTIMLLRVTGKYTTGKWAHTGRVLFAKTNGLTEAKERASNEMKVGYFNYAQITGGDEDINIERLSGQEWSVA